jgi:hypothetical protein
MVQGALRPGRFLEAVNAFRWRQGALDDRLNLREPFEGNGWGGPAPARGSRIGGIPVRGNNWASGTEALMVGLQAAGTGRGDAELSRFGTALMVERIFPGTRRIPTVRH